MKSTSSHKILREQGFQKISQHHKDPQRAHLYRMYWVEFMRKAKDDCFLVCIHGIVYDVSEFINDYSGGLISSRSLLASMCHSRLMGATMLFLRMRNLVLPRCKLLQSKISRTRLMSNHLRCSWIFIPWRKLSRAISRSLNRWSLSIYLSLLSSLAMRHKELLGIKFV